ncbi:energy-coupling factor ABC transporter ATP-binding protein [Desulfoscipio gibsoniae]|uniref:ABC-type cobalt transport system, ATPase component n=1 Tax=Desulfoscipio gibsoniae DSM 7213 TaxID=767817 RepID=R4KBE1_9FIRM|nr:ABC transporter ATP-binding protein [Desulfoscipio gibsoniae]AGK99893.1 ABC-type cobalt transport system, ATPase component [Desulfoscipio gibsoniae DSM 7213]
MAFIEMVQVSFKYPGQKKTLLHDINLSIRKDGITALTGPNGTGKTTLSKLMVGILVPSTGYITLKGQKMSGMTLAQIGRWVGYVFQNPEKQLFCPTVAEEISFGLQNLELPGHEVQRLVKESLAYFELEHLAQSFPLQLSQGEKRRLAIAAVLALEPELLVLDEPTTGLDAYRKHLLGECLDKIVTSERGVFMISHDNNFIKKYASRIIKLENGRLTEYVC